MIRVNHPADMATIAVAAPVLMPRAEDVVIARVTHEGKTMGGAIFTDFTGGSVQIHVAGLVKNWLNNDFMWVCSHYPFVQLGVRKVFAPIPSKNRRAIAFAQRLGFIEAARLRDVFLDDDQVILEMYRHQCRWLSLRPREVAEGHEQ